MQGEQSKKEEESGEPSLGVVQGQAVEAAPDDAAAGVGVGIGQGAAQHGHQAL